MIGVDTNVLVRFFVLDDARQSALARSFLSSRTASEPAFVSSVVLAELAWALKSNYSYERDQVHATLAIVLGSFNIVVEREDLMKQAIESAQAENADVSDCIIGALALEAGCSSVATFDRDAAKRVPGMELLR